MENLSLSSQAISVVKGDVRDRELLERSMQGVEVVYHLAAQSNVLGAVQDLDYSFSTNVVGTFEVLRAAERAGARRVVFTSSREVYGEPEFLPVAETASISPKNAYGASKAAGEIYGRTFAARGLEVVVFRLANVYGPRDFDRVIPLFISKALNGALLEIFGTGKVLDFLWIDDLLDVLQKAASCPYPDAPLNIGSGKGTDLVHLAERICAISAGESKIQVTETRQPEVNRFVADITRARRLLGLHAPDDPLQHLPTLIEQIATQKSATRL